MLISKQEKQLILIRKVDPESTTAPLFDKICSFFELTGANIQNVLGPKSGSGSDPKVPKFVLQS